MATFPSPDDPLIVVDPPRSAIVQFLVAPETLVHAHGEGLPSPAAGPLWADLLTVLSAASFPAPTRAITSVPPETIAAWEATAAGSEFPPERSLNRYFVIDMRDQPGAIGELLDLLAGSPGVVAAWEAPTFSSPSADFSASQTHLGGATGINASWAWGVPGGRGDGIRWAIIEQGIRLTHEDLPAPGATDGFNEPAWERHGTSTVGIIAAAHDGSGVNGIAPASQWAAFVSPWYASGVAFSSLAGRVVKALEFLSAGDVLLIELEVIPSGATKAYPFELGLLEYDAVRLASALGVCVVEPAGNGGLDLDVDPTGAPAFGPSSARSSGAVIVGAAKADGTRERLYTSNHGSRVDCWADGENVTTSGDWDLTPKELDPDRWYSSSFSQTSAASAIVAGAALIVQGVYAATTGGARLGARQLRSALKVGGIASMTPSVDRVGVMPRLSSILPALGAVPDVYVRDTIGDTGVVPSVGLLHRSPDIIVLPSPLANPQAALGEGSGTESLDTLPSDVTSGGPHTVYVRARNRGGSAATAMARVWWSPPSTLPLPWLWNLVGTSGTALVPPTGALTVLPGITWAASSLPAPGSYCFIALITATADPAPSLPVTTPFPQFVDFVANNNNVAWRNFVVVPGPPSVSAAFPFFVTGSADAPHPFSLVLETRLAAGGHLALHAPPGLLKPFVHKPPPGLFPLAPTAVGLAPNRTVTLANVVLPRMARIPVHWSPTAPLSPGDGWSITQVYKGRAVGGVHWRVTP